MADTLQIYVDHNGDTCLVGHLRYVAKRQGQSSVFEYAPEWLSRREAFALDPANLPLQSGPFFTSSKQSALPGALRDTAPDRWGQLLIKRAFRKAGEDRALSEIDYLLAMSDLTRIGALRFKYEHQDSFDHDIGSRRIPPLLQLPALMNAADAVHGNTETAEDLKLLLYQGSPLGGARPKSVVLEHDGSLAIAKFPKPDDDRNIPQGEVLALQLAARAGLNVAEARIQDVAGRPVALIKRFDRHGNLRIPFLSAMSLLGLQDGDQATYTDIAESIRMYSGQPKVDLHELFRRMVFSILVGNLDDHLRNHGFLYAENKQWRLSPAYDLNPVPAAEKVRELTTWISEAGPEADLELARSAAAYFALKDREGRTIISELKRSLKGWTDIARQLGMNAADIGVYSTAISNDA